MDNNSVMKKSLFEQGMTPEYASRFSRYSRHSNNSDDDDNDGVTTLRQSSSVKNPTGKDDSFNIRYNPSATKPNRFINGGSEKAKCIPDNVPVTSFGFPDMRKKTARQWVQQQAQNLRNGIPPWIPSKRDGTPDYSTAVAREYFKLKSEQTETHTGDHQVDKCQPILEDTQIPKETNRCLQGLVEYPKYTILPNTNDLRRAFQKQTKDIHENGIAYHQPDNETSNSLRIIQYCDLSIDTDKELGKGGFSVVHFGRWNTKLVAVKRLRVKESDTQQTEGLMSEIRIMSALGVHPNLVHLYGCVLKPFCIVLEYIELGSLHRLLHTVVDPEIEAKISDGRIKQRITLGIANGLIQLHTVGIVHRDLKPHNILISKDYTAKVSDFGLSMFSETTSTAVNSSTIDSYHSSLSGTPAYMAPELLNKWKTLSSSIDVYSFGIMLNEMISEEEPYRNEFKNIQPLDFSVIILHAKSNKRPLIHEKTPFFLRELIENCWHQEPSRRPNFEQIWDLIQPTRVSFPNSFQPINPNLNSTKSVEIIEKNSVISTLLEYTDTFLTTAWKFVGFPFYWIFSK